VAKLVDARDLKSLGKPRLRNSFSSRATAVENSFWLERWEQGETAFHLDRPNPVLLKIWPALDIAPGASVLVPLCGKSHDLIWLVEKGYRVTGIELSEKAVVEFFSEHKLHPVKTMLNDSVLWETENLRLLQGDFFAMTPAMTGPIDVVYDRAALIALPETMRSVYVRTLNRLAGMNRVSLLITLEYDQHIMNGPPFSVCEQEVQKLFGKDFKVTQLSNQQLIDRMPRFREKGLSSLHEPVYHLTGL